MNDNIDFELDECLTEVACQFTPSSQRTIEKAPFYGLAHALMSACMYIAEENEAVLAFRKKFRSNRAKKLATSNWSERVKTSHRRLWKVGNRQAEMWEAALRRARRDNLPFDIEPEDIIIPTHCPLLGLELTQAFGRKGGLPNSATLDKWDASLGYVKGNIVVISNKANMAKNTLSFKEINTLACRMLLLERAHKNKTLK